SRYVPIIFVTAFTPEPAEVLEAYRLGAVDFLMKPIQPEILKAKASVFVELQRRTAQVQRQAERIAAHVEQERESALSEQRIRLEAAALKQRFDEQRAHALELERLNWRLAEDDRRKDEFIALLGHELRNPLAPLVAGLELLNDASTEVSERTRSVMKRQIEHLIRLVDDLLDMSRISRGKIELRCARVRAGDVLEQALSLAQPLLAERRHSLTTESSGADVSISGDEVRLTQVLANLLNNAARYTEPGGAIHVSCTARDAGVELAVRDNGRGISPELLPRVFDLFMQEREGGGGLGIGLTLVKQLVSMHGGRVRASSAGIGRGSEFAVWLPENATQQLGELAEESHPEVTPAPPPPVSRCKARLRIAVVEDNEDVRMLMAELLSSWGHDVLQAMSGAHGVEIITQQSPHIAFVDIGLPDLDGYEVARQVRAGISRGPDLVAPYLVALSGFGQRCDRERALAAGFDLHLAKPASTAQLQELLDGVAPEPEVAESAEGAPFGSATDRHVAAPAQRRG
ncbi:MAG TPA: hybrid sensor histidine kinase/response regulator, partial [Polyangiaceae bacterium]|nr:hybrid sensor histidine kinase/response regulator [Polyangiaceae bacterium]